MKFKAAPQTESPQKPNRTSRLLGVGAFLSMVFATAYALTLGGCATGGSSLSPSAPSSTVELKTHSQDVKTVSGRAWVSVRVDGKKASFAGVVLIDRSTPQHAKLRLEALDPFGMLHHLIVLDEEKKILVWIDHDERIIRTAHNELRGMPLQLMPDLLAGVTQLSSLAELGLSYVVEDRGGINVLKTVNGKIKGEEKNLENQVAVLYEKFASRREYDLPRSISLNIGQGVSISLDWRSRAVNNSLRSELFNTEPVEGYRAIDF